MKKRKLKKLLKQAMLQIAGQQLPAGQPVATPAANDAPAVEGQTVAEWLKGAQRLNSSPCTRTP